MSTTAQLARDANLSLLVTDHLNVAGAPGAAVAVSIAGDAWNVGVGHADLEHRQPMPADALFSLYSMTKMFLATLVVRMSELKDSLRLEDTLQARIPDFPIARPITLRHMLNHTSGLPSYGRSVDYHDAVRRNPGIPWSRSEFLARTLEDDVLFFPGHKWHYSNVGYLLIRQILEDEAGLLFPQIVRQYLGRPFDLPSLGGVSNLNDVAALTPGYSAMLSETGDLENVIPRFHPGWIANGLATGTALDIARFLDALLGDRRIVAASLVDEMTTGPLLGEKRPWIEETAYGLGLMLDMRNPYGLVAGYTGGGPGYSVAGYHFPDVQGHRVSAVALVNRDGTDVATDIVFSMVERLATVFGE